MSLELHNLRPSKGANKNRKRVGRGYGSGHGKTAGKGEKGQKSRSGYSQKPGFEGGQMPLYRRIPKRGFTNIFRKDFAVVNVGQLEAFSDGDIVSVETLREKGLIRKAKHGLRVLGEGELKSKLTVRANHFSRSAKEKIEKAGGIAEGLS